MDCFEICFGQFPFRVCYRICLPPITPWPPHIGPWPEPGWLPELTIDGGRPEWLGDAVALAVALRAAELATGETARVLHDAVTAATAHVQQRLPEGMALNRHAHEAAYQKA